ncbi:MAG: tRNA glutamyl-Q(34) synthetase GluQRS [Alphaproteobacteria bacterium]|nr:tRNA glutamyl-Q(34) synthetase GluQRS [Alphaproteobacteria bacterium]
MTRRTVTRFAPSPTGLLHLGHAFAAFTAWRAAKTEDGRFLLRIEDIDPTRCKAEFDTALQHDLAWLGLVWDGPLRRQSEHMADYAAALARLEQAGLIYPCFCTRAAIKAEIARAGAAPHLSNEQPEPIYPGICRTLSAAERAARIAHGEVFALRLNVQAALTQTGPLDWHDRNRGRIKARPERFGDIVIARKEMPTSYHLAATLDDHVQGVNLVTRGEDLFEATHIHRLLQALLGLDTPAYAHHRLITDSSGRRFAKRDKALNLAALRERGVAPEAIIAALETGRLDPLLTG